AGLRSLGHEARDLVVAGSAPPRNFSDQQSIRPGSRKMKVRRNGERRPHEAAATRGGSAIMTRSSLASPTSNVTCLCRRHDSVSVVAKWPFSKNLLPGGPPPQYGA